MDSEVKRKLRNIIFIYLFFILTGILILGVQKLKAYIEKVRFDREQKAYNFRSEGLSRYRLSKFVYAKLEFTNHKGEVYQAYQVLSENIYPSFFRLLYDQVPHLHLIH